MSNLQIIALALVSALFGAVVTLYAAPAKNFTVVQSGNTGCIGAAVTDFFPDRNVLRIEVGNPYGQRPCGPEDHDGGK